MEKDYYILVNGKKVEVSEEVYKAYWQLTNRENYLKRLDAKYNVLPYSSFGDYEYDILDKLADKSIDIEKIVETRELLKLLELALSKLNDPSLPSNLTRRQDRKRAIILDETIDRHSMPRHILGTMILLNVVASQSLIEER